MPIVKCEICGLRTSRVEDKKRTFMAQFPLDEDRCKQWVKITGKEDLAYVPIEKLHQLKHICGKHFRPEHFKKKKTQLRKNAVPCIGITAEPLSDEILSDFPLHLPKKALEDQHLQFGATDPSIPQCSKDFSACIVQEHNYCKDNDTELSNLPSHRSDDMQHTSSHKVAVSISGNLQNENSTTETDSNDVAIDDEATDRPELEDSFDGPFTWQKQAITCADDENTNVVGNEPELIHEPKGSQNEQSMLEDLETVVECEEEGQEHGGYRCNECAGDIVGFRYLCVQCADYDVCAACEARGAHAHHYALRVPSLKPRDEVQRVIEAIQKCINDDPSLIFLPADDSVKIEVKNEDEEQPNETECEIDPLMVPTVQSLRDEETIRQVPVLEQDPLRTSNVEHLNQQFIFNASSVPDMGQDYNEVYYMSSDEPKSLYNRIEVNDRIFLVDDINNPTNSVEESDGQSTLELFSSTTQETESNVKLKLSNATNYLTKDISDLMCIKSKNLLVKLNRLDMNKLGVFTERRLKNIKNRSTIKR